MVRLWHKGKEKWILCKHVQGGEIGKIMKIVQKTRGMAQTNSGYQRFFFCCSMNEYTDYADKY